MFCEKSPRIFTQLALPTNTCLEIMPKLAIFRTNQLFNLKTGEVRPWDEASDLLANPRNLPIGFVTRVSYPKWLPKPYVWPQLMLGCSCPPLAIS